MSDPTTNDQEALDQDTQVLKEIAEQVEREREGGASAYSLAAEAPEPDDEADDQADDQVEDDQADDDDDPVLPVAPPIPPAVAARPKPMA